MAITRTQTPYELLVRWKDGAVAGAHIKFLERLVEDGEVILEREGHAQPVSMAGEVGYPLADILSTMQVTAVATAEAATVEAATARNALAAERAEHEATRTLLARERAANPAPRPT